MSTSGRDLPPSTVSAGHLAWVGLIAYITIYDVLALRKGVTTLSTAFYRLSRRRYSSPAVLLIWAVLTGHLFRIIPKKYDPFRSLL